MSARPGMSTQRLARLALLAAVALAFGWVESFIPTPSGMHLGLANTVLLYALYLMDVPSAVMLMILKVGLAGLTYRGIMGMFYSFAGSVLSLAAMVLVKKVSGGKVSIVGVSAVGAVAHNIGQLLVGAALVGWRPMIIYSPVMLLAGVAVGVVTGVVGKYAIHALEKIGMGGGGARPTPKKPNTTPPEEPK